MLFEIQNYVVFFFKCRIAGRHESCTLVYLDIKHFIYIIMCIETFYYIFPVFAYSALNANNMCICRDNKHINNSNGNSSSNNDSNNINTIQQNKSLKKKSKNEYMKLL